MEFGKISNASDLKRIDFNLPTDRPQTLEILSRGRNGPLRVYLGAPVWGVKKWVGSVYPAGTQPEDFLYHYSRQFHCIELNTTHYRVPDVATLERWLKAVPDGFLFCPKFPQAISHSAQLDQTLSATLEFIQRMQLLGPNLGLSFLQLSPSFSPRELRSLEIWLKALPKDFALAIEFRHPDWFDHHALIPQALEVLKTAHAAAVITDVAGRRDVLHTSLSTPEAFVRFIGNDLHATDFMRAQSWVERVRKWQLAGLKRVFLIVHQPGDTHAPEMIRILTEALNKNCSLNLAEWTPQLRGAQLDLF